MWYFRQYLLILLSKFKTMENKMTTQRKGMHYGFVILACCCLIMCVNIGLTFSCAGIFYQPVSEALGVSIGKFGIYMSVMYIASTILLPWAGKMIERHSARKLLSASSLLMGLTFLGMAVATSIWHIYVAGAVLGFCVAFLLYLSFPTLINRWFNVNVGLLIGVCSAASGIGGVLFNPVGAFMITAWGWRWAYAAFGILILAIVTPLLALLLRDYPKDKGLTAYGKAKSVKENKKVQKSEGVSYEKAVRTPVFYAIFIFSFFVMGCSTLNLFIPKYVQTLSFSLEEASYVASAVMIGVTVSKLALGTINDRNCLAGVLVNTLGGAAGLLLLILGRDSFPILLAGAFLFGWEYAGVTVQTAMLTREAFGTKSYARIYALVSLGLSAGGAVASGGWGLIVDITSYNFIFSVGIAMMLICSVLGVLALKKKQ